MNKSQQIYFDSGNTGNDIHTKIRLEQNINSIEFLSLSISAEDAYQNFNADYGVLIGRVIANGGIGVPNAKISIFIPISDTDSLNGDIASVYPYKTPRDKNNEGKRYNLLPRTSKISPLTGQWSPKQPFGSFPIKEEVVTNDILLSVYKKYYRYTALTNDSGDYMMFGVPIGTQTVHMSVDITDIGRYSMNPASMVTNLGYSPNLFTADKTKIKPNNDLNDLPNIETQEIDVDVIPFWGDATNFEIGITRQDFRIRSVIANTFVIFGSVFTDGDNAMWGANPSGSRRISELFRARDDANTTIGIFSKRTGKVTEKIYYYPSSVSDDTIDSGNAKNDGSDMLLLDPSEYSLYSENGNFVAIINCNRNKVITNNGVETPVADNSPNGVYTKFRGFMTIEILPDDVQMNFTGDIGVDTTLVPFRYILKFPQYAERNQSFIQPDRSTSKDFPNTNQWRKQSYTFTGGSFYSLSKFHGTVYNDSATDANQGTNNGFYNHDTINKPLNQDPFWNVGIIATNTYDEKYPNDALKFPTNSNITGTLKTFGANWMNLSIYLPQVGFLQDGSKFVYRVRSADHFTRQIPDDNDQGNNAYYFYDNDQKIAAGDINTKWFARSDLNWTDFINVPINDIVYMKGKDKGFKTNTFELSGKYRNGTIIPHGWSHPCPMDGGKLDGDPLMSADPAIYFYKGLDEVDCIEFLYKLGLIN